MGFYRAHGDTELPLEHAVRYWRCRAENAEREVECQRELMEAAGPFDQPRTQGAGITVYLGPGWVFHVSTEDGFQRERAAHRTWRVGFVAAVRGR